MQPFFEKQRNRHHHSPKRARGRLVVSQKQRNKHHNSPGRGRGRRTIFERQRKKQPKLC